VKGHNTARSGSTDHSRACEKSASPSSRSVATWSAVILPRRCTVHCRAFALFGETRPVACQARGRLKRGRVVVAARARVARQQVETRTSLPILECGPRSPRLTGRPKLTNISRCSVGSLSCRMEAAGVLAWGPLLNPFTFSKEASGFRM